ncbi:hypothetical protein ACRBEV_04530 [Methylobacterium phyllosphaerae]
MYTAVVDLGADPDQLASELGLEAGLYDRGARVPYASLGRLIALEADRIS